MNYDVFTMYYSDKISMKHPFSHVITGPSDQTPNLENTNPNFFSRKFIFKSLKIDFFGKNKSADNLFCEKIETNKKIQDLQI